MMRVSEIQRAVESFDEGNVFLRAMVGLAGALASFDRLLERHARRERDAAGDAEPVPDDDPLLLALLGAVAMKGRLAAVTSRMAKEADSAVVAERPVRSVRATGSLLR